MNNTLVLIIDDDAPFAETVRKTLAIEGYDCVVAASGEEGLETLTAAPESFGLVLLDLRLPGMDGLAVLKEATALRPDIPIIMSTAYGTVQTAVEAMHRGAFDFLLKPFPRERLLSTLERGIERSRLLRENRLLRSIVETSREADEIATRSPVFTRVLEMARQVAATDATVLLTGETGTGKERVATQIFRWSNRRDGPMVKVNCAALAENLLEAQLFGHRRGAFTGADEARKGLFEEASGGTIFLDEIGDVSPALQTKLLRVLQEREFLPVGETRPRKTDVRVIAATNRDMREAVRKGTFREDLFYRLNVFALHLPPLRERIDDVALLAQEFLDHARRRTGKNVRGLTLEALEACHDYPWPGNVRELQNLIERAVILCRGEWIAPEHLGLEPPSAKRDRKGPKGDAIVWPEANLTLRDIESAYVKEVLLRNGWGKSATARTLGVTRKTLDRKIREYGLDPDGAKRAEGA